MTFRSMKVLNCDTLARLIGYCTVAPGDTVKVAGTLMPLLAAVTVVTTGADGPVTLGFAVLAEIFAEPAATPVTLNATLVAPARMMTFAGTVAAAVLSEFSDMDRPPVGAGAERSRLILRTPPAPTETT